MRRIFAGLLIQLAVLAGCSPQPAGETGSTGDLSVNRRSWNTAAIASYRYDFQQQCFCVQEQVQPVTIEVRHGEIARVTHRDTGERLAAPGNVRWPTMDELFRIIEAAQQQGREPLRVEYDAQLGYPTRIEIGSLAADAGVIYTAGNLQPLR